MSAKKKPAAKKPAAKKPAAKKPAAKKPAAKKAAVKKPAAKKPVPKKPVPKKTVEKKPEAKPKSEPVEKKEVKRVPPRIVRRLSPNARPPEEEYIPVDTAKAVAFAMSIAQEMKRTAAEQDAMRKEAEDNGIRLARRPTTRMQGKASAKFPVSDLKMFKKRLLEARASATNGVNAMKATGFNESEDHEADGGDGTAQTLRLQALGQMGSINRTIQQIDEALHRIDDGTYGVCTACGQLIRKPRLLNQPFVLTCMECQSEMERADK